MTDFCLKMEVTNKREERRRTQVLHDLANEKMALLHSDGHLRTERDWDKQNRPIKRPDLPISQLQIHYTFSFLLTSTTKELIPFTTPKTYNRSPSISSPVHKQHQPFYHPILSPFHLLYLSANPRSTYWLQKRSPSAVYWAFGIHRHNPLHLQTVMRPSVSDFAPPVCRRHVAAPTGQSPRLYSDFVEFVWATGQELFWQHHLSLVAKPTERITVNTALQPPVLCRVPFLSQPFEFIRPWDWCGLLLVLVQWLLNAPWFGWWRHRERMSKTYSAAEDYWWWWCMWIVECGLSTVHCCLFSEWEIRRWILRGRWQQVVEWASRDSEPEWRTWSSSSDHPFS